MRNWQLIFGLCLILLGLSTASADYLQLQADLSGDRPETSILRHNQELVEFEVRLPVVDLLEGTLEGKIYDRIEIPGGGFEHELGAPEVPRRP